MANNQKIIIAAGGTGGHIFPGLAVAENLRSNGHQVEWIGTINGLESTIIPKNNISIHYIKIAGFRGKNLLTKILAPFNILLAIIQSIKFLYLLKPDTVLGMGGFVSGPVGIAAWLLGKRLIIHEQNAIAGSSNRILANFADQILGSFPNSFPKHSRYQKKIILTGLPVRKSLLDSLSINSKNNHQTTLLPEKSNNAIKNIKIADLSSTRATMDKEGVIINTTTNSKEIFKILIIGGSQGAQFLNKTVPLALSKMNNIKVLHQTGEKGLAETSDLYKSLFKEQLSIFYQVKPFIDNMLEAYLGSDLVICRAGAATIFEIMAVGVASILIPLPSAIDDHQTKNALYLVDNSAGILLRQSEATVEKLHSLIKELLADRNKLNSLKYAAKALYKQYALRSSTEYISSVIIK